MSAPATAAVAWGVEALIASALLMALVMVLRAPVRRVFGPQVAYALWALPVLRLLLPPLPAAWRDVAATPITRASETITTIMVGAPVAQVAPHAAATGPSLATIVAIAWIGGAALFLGWHLLRHARFCRNILHRGVAVDRVARVRIIESDAAPGPLAFGIVRPVVAFPRDFAERYDADERALALAHELGHHARGDLVANWAALVVLALHWFDPIAWRAFHAFRADQELANDARVLAGRPLWERHAYACAIVKAAHGGTLSAACHLHSVRDLKGRLTMLTTARTSRRRLVGGTVSVAALAAFGLALTASGTRATAAFVDTVGNSIGVDLPRTPAVVVAPPPAALVPVAAAPAPAAPVAATAPEIADVPQPGPVPPVPPVRPVPPVTHGSVTVTKDGRTIATSIERSAENGRVTRNVRRIVVRGPDGRVLSDQSSDAGNMIRIEPAVVTAQVNAGMAAQVDAAKIRRDALATAAASLRAARASVEAAMASMSAEDRREALADIAEAEAELRAEAGKAE